MGALLNRARMTTATTGTGTITLGSASNGFASFAEAGATNATAYSYCIEDGNDFEIGVGTYTSSGTTFSRDTVTLSKISGTAGTTKLTLSGSATIFITARAQEIATLDGSVPFTATQTITPAANTSALVSSGGSLTGANAQSLIDLAQTWNTSGTPTAFRLNITDTASNAASLLYDYQVGGTSIHRLTKAGLLQIANGQGFQTNTGSNDSRVVMIAGFGNVNFGVQNLNANSYQFAVSRLGSGIGEARLANSGAFAWSSSADAAVTSDLLVYRDAANTLAQRNGTNAQTFRLYGTFTDSSNHRRVSIGMTTAGVAHIRAEGAGTGASGNVLHISSLPTSNPGPGILWNNAGTPAIGT